MMKSNQLMEMELDALNAKSDNKSMAMYDRQDMSSALSYSQN
jgi:hypothetical protein